MDAASSGHLTLGWLTLIDAPPADVVSAAAAGGFEAVGIRITGRKLSDSYYPLVGHPSSIREIRRRLTDEGIRLSNASIYHLYPEITVDRVQPAIEAAADSGPRSSSSPLWTRTKLAGRGSSPFAANGPGVSASSLLSNLFRTVRRGAWSRGAASWGMRRNRISVYLSILCTSRVPAAPPANC